MSTAVASEQALPQVGYSIAEVEHILNLPHKRAYALIREGKLTAFLDQTNRLKVSPYQLMKYIEENAQSIQVIGG
jgi:hypothetical protein